MARVTRGRLKEFRLGAGLERSHLGAVEIGDAGSVGIAGTDNVDGAALFSMLVF